jgi:hypothetical protein
MNKLSSRIALLTLVGALTAVAPAFAAPPMGGNGGPAPGVDCHDPANANNPLCLKFHKPGKGPGQGNGQGSAQGMGNGAGMDNSQNLGHKPPPGNGDNPPPVNNNPPPKGSPGMGMGGPPPGFHPPPPGTFNFGQRDRDQFHLMFRGFQFGFFPAPDFELRVGAHVPRFFHLQPVPRSIYRYYPWFRGYLFFQTRDGDIVIVSRRTYRIVAII